MCVPSNHFGPILKSTFVQPVHQRPSPTVKFPNLHSKLATSVGQTEICGLCMPVRCSRCFLISGEWNLRGIHCKSHIFSLSFYSFQITFLIPAGALPNSTILLFLISSLLLVLFLPLYEQHFIYILSYQQSKENKLDLTMEFFKKLLSYSVMESIVV